MNRNIVSNHIKLEILSICAGPLSQPDNLTDGTELSLLGYDEFDIWCRRLEDRLQELAVRYHTGKHIALGNITATTTVNQCINMVI